MIAGRSTTRSRRTVPSATARSARRFREGSVRYGTAGPRSRRLGQPFFGGGLLRLERSCPPRLRPFVAARLPAVPGCLLFRVSFQGQGRHAARRPRRLDGARNPVVWGSPDRRRRAHQRGALCGGVRRATGTASVAASILRHLGPLSHIAPARRPFWLAETGRRNPCRPCADGHRALLPWAFEGFRQRGEAHKSSSCCGKSRMGERASAILDGARPPGTDLRPGAGAVFTSSATWKPLAAALPLPGSPVRDPLRLTTAPSLTATSPRGTDGRHAAQRPTSPRPPAALGRKQVVTRILRRGRGFSLDPLPLMVVLPSLEMADPWLRRRSTRSLQGGVVLAQTRLATREPNGSTSHPMPVALTVPVRRRCAPNGCRLEAAPSRRWSDPGRSASPFDLRRLADGGAASVAGIGVMEMLGGGRRGASWALHLGISAAQRRSPSGRTAAAPRSTRDACWRRRRPPGCSPMRCAAPRSPCRRQRRPGSRSFRVPPSASISTTPTSRPGWR